MKIWVISYCRNWAFLASCEWTGCTSNAVSRSLNTSMPKPPGTELGQEVNLTQWPNHVITTGSVTWCHRAHKDFFPIVLHHKRDINQQIFVFKSTLTSKYEYPSPTLYPVISTHTWHLCIVITGGESLQLSIAALSTMTNPHKSFWNKTLTTTFQNQEEINNMGNQDCMLHWR